MSAVDLNLNLELETMKTDLGRTIPRPATDRRTPLARTATATGLNHNVRRAVRAGLVSRGFPCHTASPKRLSILPPGSAAELAIDNAWTKVCFGLFALCALVMALTCYWNLEALLTKWTSFESVWRSALSGVA